MTGARSPQDIRRDLIEIGRLLRQVAEDYAWVHGFAFSPTSRHGYGEGGNTGKEGLAYSDSAGNVVSDERKEIARRMLGEISADIDEATKALRRSKKRLHRKFGHGVWDLTYLVEEGRTATKAEVIQYQEAQQRRQDRGEGWGDG